ncbi:hypothetical protein K502DRAFT_30274 [Neoconidiobolus thromboides FSU 785]|nr:hypothetical protein K502DRAFT_30274 [Neoconidiobolus thromboides FSU 785]
MELYKERRNLKDQQSNLLINKMLLLLYFYCYFIPLIKSDIFFGESKIPSLNLFQSNLPYQNSEQYLVKLEIDDNTCTIKEIDQKQNLIQRYNYTSLLYQPTIKCNSYKIHSEEIDHIGEQLSHLNYPNVGSILIMLIDGDRRPLGSPQLGLYDHSFHPDPLHSYILVPSTNQIDNVKVIKYNNVVNDWNEPKFIESHRVVDVILKVIKTIVVASQIILTLKIMFHHKLFAKLSITLLIIGILQHGGELLIHALEADYIIITFYNSSILLLATLSTFWSLYHWINSVLLLNHMSIRKLTNLIIILIYSTYFITIIIRLVLLSYLLSYININASWFNSLVIFDLVLIIVNFAILLCIVLFLLFKNKLKIYNIEFRHYKKLTNSNLLLMISFNFILLFDHLVKLFSFSSDELFYFRLVLQIFTITYNIIIHQIAEVIVEFDEKIAKVEQEFELPEGELK